MTFIVSSIKALWKRNFFDFKILPPQKYLKVCLQCLDALFHILIYDNYSPQLHSFFPQQEFLLLFFFTLKIIDNSTPWLSQFAMLVSSWSKSHQCVMISSRSLRIISPFFSSKCSSPEITFYFTNKMSSEENLARSRQRILPSAFSRKYVDPK